MTFRETIPAKLQLLFLLLLLASCREDKTLFQAIKPDRSNIHFINSIVENDSVNQLDNENVYNGGGVGIGDFDNNGLPDVFFSGNQVECKLYMNQGKFKFRDVTAEAQVEGKGRWCRGVSVVDINNDGWLDIYLSATLSSNPARRVNMLYINKGLDKNKVPVFADEAEEYGLNDDSHTTQANFFDYDNDGDLDVYLVVNEIHPKISPYLFRPVFKNGENPSTGRLYRNDWDSALHHPVFTDVSTEAGIRKEGYSHSAIITDINRDGWKDIYVGNDFLTNDLLWINNGNGTFTDELNLYFRHTSANAMGNDVGDINNDGLMDVVTLDMNPEDNFRKKMMLPANSYQQYQHTERFGYNYQYVRNTLQLNRGRDLSGRPVFSEIGYFAGITATDWSWTPLLNDFDNDGDKDLIVCNGFPKDITDHDFGMYRMKAYLTASKSQLLAQVPEVKLHNYAFMNNSDLTFSDVSDDWGLNLETFSNGAAYADLDLDGDLDLVINNINDVASLYRNYAREKDSENSHFIRVKLEGSSKNLNGLDAWVEIYYDNGKKQVWENSPYRGYIATLDNTIHFGTGSVNKIDSLIVRWHEGKVQVQRDIPADRVVTFNIKDAIEASRIASQLHEDPLFREVTEELNIDYQHNEQDFADFNIQKLLPHKYSEYGPALAAGDIDGNGLDDLVSGGDGECKLLLQQSDGSFINRSLPAQGSGKHADNAGILLFDADNDEDLDIYLASGGYEHESNSDAYLDHFYINDGSGRFTEESEALPQATTSKSCVRAADIDKDGDLDLLVTGRVDPWNYPKPVSSFIYRNDSGNGKVRFTDVTNDVAEDLVNIGLVSDALFTDFNNDSWPDIILAGEWMPLTFYKNQNGTFLDVTDSTGAGSMTGWWGSVTGGDFDNDGDIDYVAGNLGLNSFYKATSDRPVLVHAADFDNNGSFDAFPSLWLVSSQQDTSFRPYPVHGRDDAVKQMISMRARFQNYNAYANATIEEMFTPEQLSLSLTLKANCFESVYLRNDGDCRFTLLPLPAEAQFAPVYGMVAEDFDSDGNLDLAMTGNDYGTDVSIGRYDALTGLVLKGDGKGGFSPLSVAASGLYIPGNGKSLVSLRSAGGKYLVAAGQNRGPLKVFESRMSHRLVPVKKEDAWAELIYKNGKKRKLELSYGSSFFSQSGRFVRVDDNVKEVVFYVYSGEKRTVN